MSKFKKTFTYRENNPNFALKLHIRDKGSFYHCFMIEHEGIIEKISGNQVTVRILQESACSACHAKGACTVAGSKEKLIEVADFSGGFHENERVIIEGKESMGYKAVLWAFVFPLVILILTLIFTTSFWNFSETEAAITCMTALIPYYLILYLLRKKMANSFQFSIKKDDKMN